VEGFEAFDVFLLKLQDVDFSWYVLQPGQWFPVEAQQGAHIK